MTEIDYVEIRRIVIKKLDSGYTVTIEGNGKPSDEGAKDQRLIAFKHDYGANDRDEALKIIKEHL